MDTQAINLPLIESLIQAINALAPAEQNLLRSRLLQTANPPHPRQSAIDILTAAPGQQIFQTPADVDRYLQEERASWDD
jgi:hypothetical protein